MYMAIDQYGQTYHGLTHPRKELMERLYNKHCSKMYIDTKNGTKHIGYVIGQYGLTLYKIERMEK